MHLSSGTRWTVVVAGVFALLWSATSAARAIRSAHVLAWEGVVALGMLIVLVASINFVNLLTVLGVRRALEVGVRKALGASRRRVAPPHSCRRPPLRRNRAPPKGSRCLRERGSPSQSARASRPDPDRCVD